MKKVIHVQIKQGTIYAYILSQKTKLEAMPAWKKQYFRQYFADDDSSERKSLTGRFQTRPNISTGSKK